MNGVKEEDLRTRLHAADLELGDVARKAKRIQERVLKLDEQQRQGRPAFRGPWTKEAISVHLERSEEWLRTPTRAANRRRLEGLGIGGAVLKPEILDDSNFVDEVVADVERLVSACPFLKPHLIADNCLPAWLLNGREETARKLAVIRRGLDGFKRLNSASLTEKHNQELMKAAVSAPENLGLILETANQIESARDFGISVPNEGVEGFKDALSNLNADLVKMKTQFPDELESVGPSLNGLSLIDAQKILATEAERCATDYADLLSEWQRLDRTLHTLGIIAGPESVAPRSLAGLKEQIEQFREKCSERVGSEGMALLKFLLQEESDFPPGLSLEAVRRALLSLRPLIVISSRKPGVSDA